ncbi:MAG: outer membrane beta-barrel protein [Nitrospinales bacterium]
MKNIKLHLYIWNILAVIGIFTLTNITEVSAEFTQIKTRNHFEEFVDKQQLERLTPTELAKKAGNRMSLLIDRTAGDGYSLKEIIKLVQSAADGAIAGCRSQPTGLEYPPDHQVGKLYCPSSANNLPKSCVPLALALVEGMNDAAGRVGMTLTHKNRLLKAIGESTEGCVKPRQSLEWHAGIKESFTYDDNIFLDANNSFSNGTSESQIEDAIFVLSPYFNLIKERLRGEVFGFDINYLGDRKEFTDNSGQSYFNHSANMGFFFADKNEKVKFSINGKYLDTVEPITTEFAVNLAPRARRTALTWSSDLIWDANEVMTFIGEGSFLTNRYTPMPLRIESFEQGDVGVKVLFQMTPFIEFGWDYHFNNKAYINFSSFNRDSDTHTFSLMIRLKPEALISGDISIGYADKKYEVSDTNDLSTFSFNADLKYHISNKTHFHFLGNRTIEDSTFGVLDAYIRTFISLAWNQTWTSDITSSVKGGFINRDHDVPVADIVDGGGEIKTREDNQFMVEVSGIYNLQHWLQAGVAYEYRMNSSNFNQFDFSNNIFTLFLSTGF